MLNNPAQETSDAARPLAGARFPLRYQVLLPMLATMVVTLVVISALTAAMAARSAASRVDADVARIAKTLRTSTFPLTQPVLDDIAGLSGAQLLLTNAKNQIVASTTQVATSGWAPSERSVESAQGNLDRIDLGGELYFHRVVELTRPSRQEAGVDLHVLYPELAWRQARREAIYPPLLIGAMGATITAGLSILLSRRVTRPISRIAGLMADLAAGRYAPAAIPPRDDELRDLTLVANGLAAQLDELHSAIRRGERLALLGQLSGGLAHQMRNSATGARLAMQLHRRSCDADDRESIDVALRQLELVEEQLVSFLALGKPQEPRREACDLARVATDVSQLVAANFRHRGIELALEIPPTGCVVVADATQLRQVLINLTLNALDAVDRGGKVRIVLAPLTDCVRLSVFDSGPGVRSDVADSLFEPFSTTKPEGIGLGLAVASRIIAAHGGLIEWSRHGAETVFELQLPSQQRQATGHGTTADERMNANADVDIPHNTRTDIDEEPPSNTASKEPIHA